MQPPSYPPPDDLESPYAGSTPRYVAVQTPRVRPIVTYTLIGITVAVFLLQLAGQYLLGEDIVALLGLKVNELILENHLRTCVTTAIRGDDPARREAVSGEILDVFAVSNK